MERRVYVVEIIMDVDQLLVEMVYMCCVEIERKKEAMCGSLIPVMCILP